MVIDPVCKMQIEESSAAATSEFKGQKINFCSEGCKQKFDSNPEQYAVKAA